VIRRPKVASELAREIMREALARGLRPGEHFGSEQELITRYGAARASVREALRLLEAHGVLELRRGGAGGIIIVQPQRRTLASSLAMVLQSSGGNLRTVIDARNVIEPRMASLAAEHRSEGHLQDLDECIKELHASSRDPERYHYYNRRFHDIVAEASGNELLAALMPALSWMSAAIGWELPEHVREDVATAKEAIVTAIRARKGAVAFKLMANMVQAADQLDAHDPELFRRPIVWADVDELLQSDDQSPD